MGFFIGGVLSLSRPSQMVAVYASKMPMTAGVCGLMGSTRRLTVSKKAHPAVRTNCFSINADYAISDLVPAERPNHAFVGGE